MDGWVSVSPGRRASSSSRGHTRGKTITPKSKGKRDKDVAGENSSEGEENLPQRSKNSERNGRGRATEEHPPEASTSAPEGAGISPGRGDVEGRKVESRTAPATMGILGGVEKAMDQNRERGLFASSGRVDSVRGEQEQTRKKLDTGRVSDRKGAAEASTKSWNDNDLEVS